MMIGNEKAPEGAFFFTSRGRRSGFARLQASVPWKGKGRYTQ